MKVRQGFVSNSSSSSFVILLDREIYDKVRPTLDPFDAFFVNEAFSSDKFLGKECLSFGEMSVQDYSYWSDCGMSELIEKAEENDIDIPEGYLSTGEVNDRVSKAMEEESKDSVFTYHMDG